MDGFNLFGIGPLELFTIAVIALIVLGPERLPGTFREVAKFIRQLRAISNELTSQFSEEFKMLDELNPRKLLDEATNPKKAETSDKTANDKTASDKTKKDSKKDTPATQATIAKTPAKSSTAVASSSASNTTSNNTTSNGSTSSSTATEPTVTQPAASTLDTTNSIAPPKPPVKPSLGATDYSSPATSSTPIAQIEKGAEEVKADLDSTIEMENKIAPPSLEDRLENRLENMAQPEKNANEADVVTSLAVG